MYIDLGVTVSFGKGIPAIKSQQVRKSVKESPAFKEIFNKNPITILGTPPENYERFMHFKVKPESRITLTQTGKLLLDPSLKWLSKIGEAPFNMSGKHVHLTQEDFLRLYGYSMPQSGKPLIQPGQYVIPMEEFINRPNLELPEPQSTIKGFSIIGGPRSESQAEIDLNYIEAKNMNIPHRDSGDLEGAPTYQLKGPKGTVPIKVICAVDHLHLPNNVYTELEDLEKVLVTYQTSNGEKYVYPNVKVRRGSPKTTGLEVHINKCQKIEEVLRNAENPTAAIYKYHF